MEENRLKEFKEKVKYSFQNVKLLKSALTHSSYANEHHMDKMKNNERLEYLGDAVLELCVREYLGDAVL